MNRKELERTREFKDFRNSRVSLMKKLRVLKEILNSSRRFDNPQIPELLEELYFISNITETFRRKIPK